jgi:hypothetical protein
MHLELFVYIHNGFFVTPRFMIGILGFLIWETIFLFEKVVGMCHEHTNKWVSSEVFE